jgi:hypothetical protein
MIWRLFLAWQAMAGGMAIAWTVYGIRRRNERHIVEGLALFVVTVFATAIVWGTR